MLVDDGSESAEALAALDVLEVEFGERGWRVIRQENRYLGAARNAAAAVARGEWLLFLDDDNVLFPDAVSRLVRAARFSGADCVPAASIRFYGDGDPRTDTESRGTPIRFLGAARAWSRIRNVAGDACALIRRKAFEAAGGFTEEYRVGLDDLSFYNCLIRAGRRVEPMPDPAYYYRFGTTTMKGRNRSKQAAQVRVLAPFIKGLPADERAFAAFAMARIHNPPGRSARPAPSQERKGHRAVSMGRLRRFRIALLRAREALMALVAPGQWRARRVVGAVESRELLQVRGWLLDRGDLERRRSVSIHVQGRQREVIVAESRRDDIARWRGTDGYHGFLWQIPEDVVATDGARIDVFDAVTGVPLRGSPARIEGGRVIASERRRT